MIPPCRPAGATPGEYQSANAKIRPAYRKDTIIDYDPRTGAVNKKTNFPLVGGLDSAFPIAGVEFTYRPWGLGFTYASDIQGEGAQSYGLKWSREWGGPSK